MSRRPAPHPSLTLALCSLVATVPVAAQWSPLPSRTTVSLRGLSVVDGATVWASGARGTVLHSADSGATWRVDTIPGARGDDLRAIHAHSARVAHVAATAGRIWRTVDGGRTWELRYQSRDTSVFLDALAFWDDQHGLALGDPVDGRFLLLRTDDGGDTWRELGPDERPVAMAGEAAFAASGSSLLLRDEGGARLAWIGTGGAAARVHRSVSGGRAWVAYDTPIRQGEAAAGIFSLAAVPEGGLVAVGGHYAQDDSTRGTLALGDGVGPWRAGAAGVGGYRSGVAFTGLPSGGTVGLAVGPAGTDLTRDGGAQWTPFDRTGFHAVRASGDGIFYASGSGGRLARFDARAMP